MAIISISREVAAFGDEIATLLAQKLNYKFITRKEIEKRIVELGFSESKLSKYDERKPGFFASLIKDRDEYLNYAQYAILEAAEQKNVVIIGRGSFAVLHDVPNNISIRLIADEQTRISRLQSEFNWTVKQAQARIQESDSNRDGFHKSFFNVDIHDSTLFHAVLNTGMLSIEQTADLIKKLVEDKITVKQEEDGNILIERLLKAQKVINKLSFDFNINIEFMHISFEGQTLFLHGIAESNAIVERALIIIKQELPEFEVKSSVSIINNYKPFR